MVNRPPVPKPPKREPRPRGFNSSLPQASKPIERKTRVKASRPDRKAEKTEQNFGTPAFRKWTKRQPCAICGLTARKQWKRDDRFGNDMAHVKDRGMGGCNSDWMLVIPVCPDCHDAGLPRGRFDLAEAHQRAWATHTTNSEGA